MQEQKNVYAKRDHDDALWEEEKYRGGGGGRKYGFQKV
jgi:hypothetical protein